MSTDLVIARLDAARLALSEARTIQDTKKILDVAAAAEIYAKRQKLSDENIAFANEVKIEALRQLGEFLRDIPKNRGELLRGSKSEPRENVLTLADQGIDKKTSMTAQRLASLSAEKYEEVKSGKVSLAKATATPKPTQNAAAPAAEQPGRGEASEDAATQNPAPAAAAPDEDELSDEEISEAEKEIAIRELAEEKARERLAFILLDEDDPLNAVIAENVKMTQLLAVAESRIAGLQGENGKLITEIKKLQRKAK